MMKIKSLYHYWPFFLLTFAFIFLGIIVFLSIPVIPDNPLRAGMLAVSKARDRGTAVYYPVQWRLLTAKMDSAYRALKSENKKFILFRDYSGVQYIAGVVIKMAAEAESLSITEINRLQESIPQRLNQNAFLIEEIKSHYERVPVEYQIQFNVARADMLLNECRNALRRNALTGIESNLNEIDRLLKNANIDSDKILKAYLKNMDKWRSWVDEALTISTETETPVVIIDKLASVCRIYHSGMLLYFFDAEFGQNWIGHKIQMGDKRTPEGRYFVKEKRLDKKTIYYKALLLNYPNMEDSVRFNYDVGRGLLSEKAKMGGQIEIHGEGGKGVNWTDGCVALENQDMDILFDISEITTPVIIVGSLNGKREKSIRNEYNGFK